MRLPVMVMEMMADSLTSLVDKYEKIPVHIKFSIVHGVSLGLCYLHNHDPPIVHRDLSPNNILLTTHHVAKISDLGVAKVIKADSKKTMTKAPGTTDFMPPEALCDKPEYGPPMDVFSFGGIILHTFNQNWPHPSDKVVYDRTTKINNAFTEVQRRQQYLDAMRGEAEEMRPLVKECLDDDPSVRPTIAAVCESIQASKDCYMNKSSRSCPQDIITLYHQVEQLRNENEQQQVLMNEIRTINELHKSMDDQGSHPPPVYVNLMPHSMDVQSTSDLTPDTQSHIKRSQTQTLPATRMPQIQVPDVFSGPVSIKWREGTPAPENQAYHTAVFHEGNIYVGGGINQQKGDPSFKIEVYNPEKDMWGASIDLSRCWFALTTLNNRLVIAGGQTSGLKVTKKIFLLESYRLKLYCTKMTKPRFKASAVGHQGTLIIVGGLTEGKKCYEIIPSTELFDSINKQWYTTDQLPLPQYGLRSVIADNVLYLLGGIDQDGKASPAVFTASLDTLFSFQLKWISHQDFLWLRSAPVSMQGRQVLVMGGTKLEDSGVSTSTSDIHMFNKISDKWDVIGQMPFERRDPAVVGLPSNKIVVIGGLNYKDKVTDGVWVGSCRPQ
ncbi:uncharacterized protein [Dysidea avara]|uniref:uncharacterized protein n=1 Tax=Dysidea avara TaxID=196820 RepID=UPI00333207F3